MKIIKVNKCEECPYSLTYYLFKNKFNDICGTCMLIMKDIKTDNKIPKWCPLEDYKK